jgi:hypothetical protein
MVPGARLRKAGAAGHGTSTRRGRPSLRCPICLLGLLGHCPEAGLSGQCPLGDVGVASRPRRFLRWHRTARALKEIDQELDSLVALGSGVGIFGTGEQARGEISTSPNQTTRDVFDRLGLVVDHRRLDLVGTALRRPRPKENFLHAYERHNREIWHKPLRDLHRCAKKAPDLRLWRW